MTWYHSCTWIYKITISEPKERLYYLKAEMKREKEFKITSIIFSGNKYMGTRSFKHLSEKRYLGFNLNLKPRYGFTEINESFSTDQLGKKPKHLILHFLQSTQDSAMGIQISSPIIFLFSHSKGAIAKKLVRGK